MNRRSAVTGKDSLLDGVHGLPGDLFGERLQLGLPPEVSVSWKPDFSATSRLRSMPISPLPAAARRVQTGRRRHAAVAAGAAGDENPFGHQRLSAVGQVLGHDRQGVEPRVGERLDLADQDRRFGQTFLEDPGTFTAAGEDLLTGSRPGR